jgi:hypothetical protein
MKAPLPPIEVPGSTPFQKMDNLFRAVIAVPKEEIDRREEKWKRSRVKKRPGQEKAMTVAQTVVAFIQSHKKQPFCDGCIASKLGIRHQQAQQATAPLAAAPGFSQYQEACSICGQDRKVTMAL